MTILWAILIGLGLGFLSGFFSKRRDPGSLVVSAIIGIIAGLIAGIVAGIVAPSSGSALWIAALFCIVLLLLYRLIIGNREAP